MCYVSAPAALAGLPGPARMCGGLDNAQRQECVAHDVERWLLRLVAMLDKSEGARKRRMKRPHDEIGHVLGN
jgi:hypothetical protein